jgi:hypothetical protein
VSWEGAYVSLRGDGVPAVSVSACADVGADDGCSAVASFRLRADSSHAAGDTRGL